MQLHESLTGESRNRAVLLESFGGPEKLVVKEMPVPSVAPDEIRIRVSVGGLNPMDWFMTSDPETAARFNLKLPSGYGSDYAGVVDQVGNQVANYSVGDRVYGAAISRAFADYVVVKAEGNISDGIAFRTPAGVEDHIAATLAIAGSTAAHALDVAKVGAGDTVLVGGAGGGVGVFAVQLARLVGARVIGTGSPSSADYIKGLGAEPVAYGPGLADRVRAIAGNSVTTVLDLHGREAVDTGRELGVPDPRMCTIAGVVEGISAANGASAGTAALENIARLIAEGQLHVPVAASYPVAEIRQAVELQAGRHVRGKVVVEF